MGQGWLFGAICMKDGPNENIHVFQSFLVRYQTTRGGVSSHMVEDTRYKWTQMWEFPGIYSLQLALPKTNNQVNHSARRSRGPEQCGRLALVSLASLLPQPSIS